LIFFVFIFIGFVCLPGCLPCSKRLNNPLMIMSLFLAKKPQSFGGFFWRVRASRRSRGQLLGAFVSHTQSFGGCFWRLRASR
jgi:hypothetical protein